MIRRDDKVFDKLQIKLPDTCNCGRSTQMIHCPDCGSTDVRVSKRLSAGATTFSPLSQERVPVRWLTCRRCSIAFAEDGCFRACNAPVASWRREDNIANKIVPPLGQPLNEFQKETLRGLAKLRPDKAKTITERLNDNGPGLLERVERDKEAPPEIDPTLKDLMKPPKLDEE